MATSLWARALANLPDKDQRLLCKETASSLSIPQILTEILAEIKVQHDLCQRDRSKTLGADGRQLVIRDVCVKIADCVNKFVEVVDVIVSYDPGHAALPWAGVRLVLQLCLSGLKAFDAIVEGLYIAVKLIAQGEILEALYTFEAPSSATSALEEKLRKGYETVLKFLVAAKRYSQQPRIWRMINISAREALPKCVKEMEHAEKQILDANQLVESQSIQRIEISVRNTELSTTSMAKKLSHMQASLKKALDDLGKPLARVVDQVSALYEALKDHERTELLQWLSVIPVESHYTEALASLQPDSGSWLLQNPAFIDWRDSSTSDTFWLHGIPGCGKSKLATVVVRYLRSQSPGLSQSTPLAHFFCLRNPAEPGRNDANEILRSLVKQLSLSKDEDLVRTPLVDMYRKHHQNARRVGEGPATLTVEQCIDLLCELGRLVPVIIVIDGLDECNSQQRMVLLQSLEKVHQRSRDLVKIFVSSRYEEDIAASLGAGKVLCITVKDVQEDLKSFIANHVGRFIQRWSIIHTTTPAQQQQLEQDLTHTLITRAQGMFLWVTLQLEYINDTDRIKTLDDIRMALLSLPATLTQSYAAIHCRIEALGPQAKAVARLTLQWLLGAKRMLSVAELIAAVGRSANYSSELSPRTIMDYCCQLVIIDKSSDSFRLAHLTVREYLESMDAYCSPEVNLNIAQGCLDVYLGGNRDGVVLRNYSTKYWPVHVEELESTDQRARIKPSLVDFFTKGEHFEDWLEDLKRILTSRKENSCRSTIERKLHESFSPSGSPLFMISCFGFIEVLQETAVTTLHDPNQRNQHDSAGLYLAARGGHFETVRKLLELGADVNAPGFQYGTALQAACAGGWQNIVQLLLTHGASYFSPLKGDFSSPLQAALANNHETIANQLIDAVSKSAHHRRLDRKQFEDALEIATFTGNIHIVHRLLEGEIVDFVPKVHPDDLQVALAAGKVRHATQLLKACTDINETKGLFGNALAAAIASGKLSLVKLVIEAGAQLDVRGRYGYPLRAAALAGNTDIARLLLEKGADPNVTDDELGDALQAAATGGNLDMMLLLLDHNADAQGSGGHFGHTVQAAAFSGHEQAVRLLLDRGAKVEFGGEPPSKFRDALQAAVYAGHEGIVNMLLVLGNVNPGYGSFSVRLSGTFWSARRRLPDSRDNARELDVPSKLGPLEVASRQGNITLVTLLLHKGAEPDFPKNNRWNVTANFTALQIAAFWGHSSVVECLLTHGADANAVRHTLGTPLQAALEGGHTHVADILLSHGACIDRHWEEFGSCLQVYAERGNIDIVRFLLDRGSNINDSGGQNGSAIQVACGAGHFEMVQLLLQEGADVNAAGKNIGSALQAASSERHHRIVQMLLDHGANVDQVESGTPTALSFAAQNGDVGLMSLLLDNGANADGTATRSGNSSFSRSTTAEPITELEHRWTPLHYAAYNGHKPAISLLLNSGANVHLKRSRHNLKNELHFFKYRTESPVTPLQIAWHKGFTSIAKMLFRHDPWGYVAHQAFGPALTTDIGTQDEIAKIEEVTAVLVDEALRVGFTAEHFRAIFEHACRSGCVGRAKAMLGLFPIESWPGSLLAAVNWGKPAVVQLLLDHGADFDCCDDTRDSALIFAIKHIRVCRSQSDFLGVVEVLINAGAVLSKAFVALLEGAIMYIAQYEEVDFLQFLQFLHRVGIQRVFLDPTHFSEILVAASEKNRGATVKYLCSLRTPTPAQIHKAILAAATSSYQTSEVIQQLLRFGLPPAADGDVPVQICQRNYVDALAILLQHNHYPAPVIEAVLTTAISERSVDCAALLLSLPLDEPRSRVPVCTRLIHLSLEYPRPDMLSLLLKQGVDPDTRHPENGCTLLYLAASGGKTEMVETLLSHGADVSLTSVDDQTALHAAAFAGKPEAVRLILAAGADVDPQSIHLGSPLAATLAERWFESSSLNHTRCCGSWCHFCCAEVLLNWGASPDALDEDSVTRFAFAYGQYREMQRETSRYSVDLAMLRERCRGTINAEDLIDSPFFKANIYF
ncbi:ankyrin repeat-containing domain protein [Aspergillus coremiiformis]|uniref:Ankyrin repeat-containing domain protein n=1 Tax=Aspergillus coremiiformis TaxID=138285 RepID=A0A5N6Z9B2_9EURO|nr:ankyrin repeat-containing domain protein [Aspergillus coremiiformis]